MVGGGLVQRTCTIALVVAALGGSLIVPVQAVSAVPERGASSVGTYDPSATGLTVWGGRSGASLATIWVDASLDGADTDALVGQPVVLQQLSGGTWSDRASTPAKADAPVRFAFPEPAAITVRVVVPAAGVASPVMELPAAPALGRSRYYVRSSSKGSGRWILRVYEDGTVYGISHAGMEYSCLVGALADGTLTLTTFDFGGGTVTLPATGTWKQLKIRDRTTKPVGGARKSLTGKYLKDLRRCAAPTYAAVSTHE